MPYHAGELDQRVTFRREVPVPDEMGGHAHTWVDVATVWALIRPLSGREREHSQKLNAEAGYLIVIRNRTDISETDMAVWNGMDFNIRFRKDRARSHFLEIEA